MRRRQWRRTKERKRISKKELLVKITRSEAENVKKKKKVAAKKTKNPATISTFQLDVHTYIIERGQFSSVAGARLFSLGKIQMRISFGDLESKGISHLFRRIFG